MKEIELKYTDENTQQIYYFHHSARYSTYFCRYPLLSPSLLLGLTVSYKTVPVSSASFGYKRLGGLNVFLLIRKWQYSASTISLEKNFLVFQ